MPDRTTRLTAYTGGIDQYFELHPLMSVKVDPSYKNWYCPNVMKTIEVPVSHVGKGCGVKLPSATVRRYKIGNTLLLEELPDAIVLRPAKSSVKLSWDETAKAMAGAKEDWSEWDGTLADGLNELPARLILKRHPIKLD